MKILLISPTSDFMHQISDALIAEGHTLVHIDDRADYSLPPNMRPWRWLWWLSRRIPWLRGRANQALQAQVTHTALRERPDLVLATKGMNIKLATLMSLRRMHIPTAVWFPDNAANEPYASWVRTLGAQWDHFLSFDSAIRDQIPADSRARIHVLPFGVDPKAFEIGSITDQDRARYSCDVCLVGAPYPDRVALLDLLRGTDVRVWGWSGWKKTPLKKIWHGQLNAQESAKAYRLAKICLNTNILPHARGVNLKTFEIAASGGFQLSDHLPDLDASFTVGKEIEVFNTPEEFQQKVSYWLEHDQERRAIAAAGRERVFHDHLLRQRVRTMMEMIFSR